jgi:hypothetical protein
MISSPEAICPTDNPLLLQPALINHRINYKYFFGVGNIEAGRHKVVVLAKPHEILA